MTNRLEVDDASIGSRRLGDRVVGLVAVHALAADPGPSISAGTLLEARIVMQARYGEVGVRDLDLMVQAAEATVVPVGRARAKPGDVHEVRLRAGLLFQNPDDQLFCPSVREHVAFGPRIQGLSAEEADARADEVVGELGLSGLAGRPTHRLSGGEQRLVALATFLAMRPELMLLDEPTAGLDQEAERRLLDVLSGLPQALLVVSHGRRLIDELRLAELRLEAGRLHPA